MYVLSPLQKTNIAMEAMTSFLSFFGAMMRMLAMNAALAVLAGIPVLLQMLSPRDLFCCRLDGAQRFFKLLFTRAVLDQSFKVSSRNVWVFWL